MKTSLPFALACALIAQPPPAPRPRPQQPQGQAQTQQARPGRGGPFASAPAATAAPISGTASIAGRVLDSAGAPVPRAVVSIETQDRNARNAKTMSGADGSFLLPELPAGKYWVVAEKAGFLRSGYRSRTPGGFGDPVDLADGASRNSIDIQLSRQGVISGRVLDDAGEPAERILVQAISMRPSSARNPFSNSALTNDLGEFRLTKLPPGSYKLLATRAGQGGLLVEHAPGKTPTAEAPTYFPGTLEESSAATVRVNAGDERTGTEIRLLRSTVVTLAGRVSGDLPPGRGTRVVLRGAAAGLAAGPGRAGAFAGMMGPGGDGAIAADGTFFFRQVRPGDYTLSVIALDRGGPKTLGSAPVSVGQNDVSGVGISVAPPPDIQGRVRADGDPPFPFAPVQISLQSTGPMRGPFGGAGGRASSDASGNFTLTGVSREKQILQVQTPAGIIVKSISIAGQPLPGLEVDFASTSGPLEILLSNKPATISGSVEGLTPDSPRFAVWAIPDAEPLSIAPWNTKRLRQEASSPSFTLDSLRPGTYRICAFEDVESDLPNDPAFWQLLQANTETVKVAEGESAQVKLKLITLPETEGL
jgi:hypothetical protein